MNALCVCFKAIYINFPPIYNLKLNTIRMHSYGENYVFFLSSLYYS